eukprot:30401-Pelagococcus_subviridis.AAC.2
MAIAAAFSTSHTMMTASAPAVAHNAGAETSALDASRAPPRRPRPPSYTSIARIASACARITPTHVASSIVRPLRFAGAFGGTGTLHRRSDASLDAVSSEMNASSDRRFGGNTGRTCHVTSTCPRKTAIGAPVDASQSFTSASVDADATIRESSSESSSSSSSPPSSPSPPSSSRRSTGGGDGCDAGEYGRRGSGDTFELLFFPRLSLGVFAFVFCVSRRHGTKHTFVTDPPWRHDRAGRDLSYPHNVTRPFVSPATTRDELAATLATHAPCAPSKLRRRSHPTPGAVLDAISSLRHAYTAPSQPPLTTTAPTRGTRVDAEGRGSTRANVGVEFKGVKAELKGVEVCRD